MKSEQTIFIFQHKQGILQTKPHWRIRLGYSHLIANMQLLANYDLKCKIQVLLNYSSMRKLAQRAQF